MSAKKNRRDFLKKGAKAVLYVAPMIYSFKVFGEVTRRTCAPLCNRGPVNRGPVNSPAPIRPPRIGPVRPKIDPVRSGIKIEPAPRIKIEKPIRPPKDPVITEYDPKPFSGPPQVTPDPFWEINQDFNSEINPNLDQQKNIAPNIGNNKKNNKKQGF